MLEKATDWTSECMRWSLLLPLFVLLPLCLVSQASPALCASCTWGHHMWFHLTLRLLSFSSLEMFIIDTIESAANDSCIWWLTFKLHFTLREHRSGFQVSWQRISTELGNQQTNQKQVGFRLRLAARLVFLMTIYYESSAARDMQELGDRIKTDGTGLLWNYD